MKKRLCVLLIAAMLLLLVGCSNKKDDIVIPVTVEGSIFSGEAEGKIPLDLKFNYDWITKGNNKKYNADLAAFSALLCDDAYFRQKDLEKGSQNRVVVNNSNEEYDFTLLLKELGFTDTKHIESFKEKEYSFDSNDSVTMNLGYINVDDKYDTFVVTIRGCFSAGEWSSVFDPGCTNGEYESLTGEHPEWINKNVFKGIDIATNRAKEFIDEFVKEHDDPKRENTMLLTGHSRGGSIANNLGNEFEKTNYAKMYTYTFNTMNTVTASELDECKTVFNIADTNDFYGDCLPFVEEGFARNGTDNLIKVNDSNEIKKQISGLLGKDNYVSVSDDFVVQYKGIFQKIFPNRDAAYIEKELVKNYPNKEKAEEDVLALNELADSMGIANAYFIGDINESEDGTCSIKIVYYGATVLQGLSKVFAYGQAAGDAMIQLFAEEDDIVKLVDLVNNNAKAISGGHVLANSYIISKNVK